MTTSQVRSLPPNSAIGLSAFYISLLALMCGFLGAVLVNSSIDAVLGYSTSEIGPRWRQRMPVAISRWQTLLTKWSVAFVAVPILTGILLLVAVGLLHMNAPYVGELWLFLSFTGIAIAAGTLALFAAFGSLGQLLAMLLFVYLALASSGGTIPVQALPSFFRFAASFEPLRQVLGGVRAILYFNAQGDAGLFRGILVISHLARRLGHSRSCGGQVVRPKRHGPPEPRCARCHSTVRSGSHHRRWGSRPHGHLWEDQCQ